jgi:YD repeat-containing protein
MSIPQAAAAQTPFSHTGVDGLHPGSSVLPNEQVDPASGNLTVVATDLVLPGNAGLNIQITRVYNSAVYPDYTNGSTQIEEDSWAGIGWRLHFGRVLNNESVIEMGDGSRHALHAGLSGGWITTEFWLYDKTTHTLKLPSGLVYQFDREVSLNSQLGNARYVTEIRDPYNNRLTVSYFSAPGPPDGVQQIRQDLGSGQIQTVTFTYDSTLKALETMTYGTRVWRYQQNAAGPAGYSHLTRVTPPIGPVWSYEYAGMAGEMTKLTTPSGGFLSYTYADATRRAGSLAQFSRVVSSRTTGGPEITSGTWTYSYSAGSNQDTTVVTCPCGTQKYRFNGTGVSGDFSGWLAGTLAEQTMEDGSIVLERRTNSYGASEIISNDVMVGVNGTWTNPNTRIPLLAESRVFRGNSNWTTAFTYHWSLGNYNDYGRPFQSQETDTTVPEYPYRYRLTTRTFQYGFTPYIVNRIASESIGARVSYDLVQGPVSSTWTYEAATGFLSSQNVFGIASAFERGAEGNVSASIDALGHRTAYTHFWGVMDTVTPPSSSGNPGTHVTRGIYSDGTVASVANDIDLPILYTYDVLGRLTSSHQNGFNGSAVEYDLVNNRFVRVSAGPTSFTEYTLDGFGRAVRSVNLANLKNRVERDACGRVTFSSAPYTTGSGTRGMTRQFDILGRVTRETDSAGAVTTYAYDGVGVTRTDAALRTTEFQYYAFSGPGDERLGAVRDATTILTSYLYDVHGNLLQVNGPGTGVTRTWTRGWAGQTLTDTQPESGTTTNTYDNAGNLTQTTDANQQTTTWQYYPDNRLKLRDAPGTTDDLSITYNAAGRVSTLQSNGTTTTFGYNTRGLVGSRSDVSSSWTFASAYGYDNDDLLASVVYPTGRTVSYEHTTEHRLAAVRQNGSLFANTFNYDDAGRLGGYQTGAVTHTFAYDLADRPAHLQSVAGGGSLDLTYAYDVVGNVRSIADPRSGATQLFTVDALDRLDTADGSWGHLGWTYDARGNRLTQTGAAPTSYTYDAATQRLLSSSGSISETFGYDSVGRLTSDSFGTYTYTSVGSLASANRPGMGASYTYDPTGGRLGRTVNNQTTYSVRSADGAVLSEYTSACSGALAWDRDVIYATGRLLGAVRSTVTGPTVSTIAPSLSTTESGSLAVGFVLTTPGGTPLSCPVTASYHTTNGTATAGVDFGVRLGTVTFPAGSLNGARQWVTIPITPDALAEGDETLFVDLLSASGASIGASGRTTVTITTKDFNADGWPDLVWRRLGSGDNGLWWMTGASLISATSLLPTGQGGAAVLADMNWEIRGVGDFNGDGKPDLLWQNQSTGDVAVWTFSNQQRITTLWLSLLSGTHGDSDLNWKVVGAADMDGDGKLDLVWSHAQTGALRVWHFNGLVQVDSAAVSLSTGDPLWQVASVADMNSDGHPDLVWRRGGTGGIATWLLNDTQVLNTLWLSPDTVSDLAWRIVGAVDMNADGQTDLVWQNVSSGQLGVWYMNGTTLSTTSVLGGSPQTDTNWRIVGVR